MSADPSSKLAKKILIEPAQWISGVYVLEDGPHPAVIIVQTTPELLDVSVYNYSFLGLGPNSFFLNERLLWPVGSESVFHYTLVDETRLELTEEISWEEVPNNHLWEEVDWEEARLAANILCPLLTQLKPLHTSEYQLEELTDDDLDTFTHGFPGLLKREAPNFWSLDDEIYGWKERDFGDGRKFREVQNGQGFLHRENEILDQIGGPELDERGMYELAAYLIQVEDGALFVVVDDSGLESYLQVRSEEEGRDVLDCLW